VENTGVLAVVTLQALDMGNTDLTLQNLRLLSPTGEELQARVKQGSVQVYPHGDISGVVLDSASKEPVERAKVEVSKGEFTFGISTYSGEDGTYTLEGVPVGDFDVTASRADHLSETISNVHVEKGKDTRDVDITIKSFLTASTITIPTPIAVGETAPDFTLQDIDGKQIRLSDLSGKPIILNFWDSASDHCRRQIFHLNALYRKYRGHGLVVIGISKEMARAVVLEFARSQMSYITVLDGAEAFQAYGLTGIPCIYCIDRTSKVRYRDVGFSPGGEVKLEQKIKELLDDN
jgi:peroxiredoxin